MVRSIGAGLLAAMVLLFAGREALAACSSGVQVGTDCGTVPGMATGCCKAGVGRYGCENGVLCLEACTDCGFVLGSGGYECGTLLGTGNDNCPTIPAQTCVSCNGVSSLGCCNGTVVTWCDAGCLKTIDCSTNTAPADTCGWDATNGFYDCGQTGADPSGTHPLSCPGPCTPGCTGKACGDDGCGGSCGTCVTGRSCVAGSCVGASGSDGCVSATTAGCGGCACETCVCGADAYCCSDMWDATCVQECTDCGSCTGTCTPDCSMWECGDDGCGGSCGSCVLGQVCQSGICAGPCTPDCAMSECGDDGCGGSCGTCPASQTCTFGFCSGGGCFPACTGMECGDDGCGGVCGVCMPPKKCSAEGQCYDPSICQPACTGKECGDDACGGVCGTCMPPTHCSFGVCVKSCSGIGYVGCCNGSVLVWCQDGDVMTTDCSQSPTCGWDPGASFYSCATDGAVDPAGVHPLDCSSLCSPSCGSHECGPDGCGGSCGECAPDRTCSAAGLCVVAVGGCAGLSWQGCCDGEGIRYCGDGEPVSLSCDGLGPCGWDETLGYYDCDTAGTPDPSGTYPMTCGGCAGQCDGRDCGSDGCGGTCGACLPGQECVGGVCGAAGAEGTPDGAAPEASVSDANVADAIEPDGRSEALDPADLESDACPDGTSLYYGSCRGAEEAQAVEEVEADGPAGASAGGCSAGGTGEPARLPLLLVAVAILLRRTRVHAPATTNGRFQSGL